MPQCLAAGKDLDSLSYRSEFAFVSTRTPRLYGLLQMTGIGFKAHRRRNIRNRHRHLERRSVGGLGCVVLLALNALNHFMCREKTCASVT